MEYHPSFLIQLFVNSAEYTERVKVLGKEVEFFDEIEELVNSLEGRNYKLMEENVEPKVICVTCHNETTKEGGIYEIKNDNLEPIFTKTACFGMFSTKKSALLALRKIKNKFPGYWCVTAKSI